MLKKDESFNKENFHESKRTFGISNAPAKNRGCGWAGSYYWERYSLVYNDSTWTCPVDDFVWASWYGKDIVGICNCWNDGKRFLRIERYIRWKKRCRSSNQ